MTHPNDCAPARGKAEARGDTYTDPRSVAHDAMAGKALAVWLYNVGVRSLGDTDAAFHRHPEWRYA